MRSTLARTAALLAAGMLCGFAFNAVRKGGVGLASWSAPAACGAGGAHAQAPTELAAADVASLCGQPDVVIADARPAARFAEGHVAGAVHLPCDAGGRVASDALARFERAGTIVVYGDATDDARPVAASLLRRHPDVRVAILTGGVTAWSSAGLACASGPCDECKLEVSRP